MRNEGLGIEGKSRSESEVLSEEVGSLVSFEVWEDRDASN